MARQGAELQRFNNELALGLEELKTRRSRIAQLLSRDQTERTQLASELSSLTNRVSRLDAQIAHKLSAQRDLDSAISQAQAAYLKILESSQALLSVVQETGRAAMAVENEQDLHPHHFVSDT